MKTALIVGAGIIGLSVALELATRGIDVTVLERGEAMREASWAAAGMLAANDPENPPQLAGLAQMSLALYPTFLTGIEQLSGLSVPLRTTRTLQICQPGHRSASGQIDVSEALRLVPGLSADIDGPLLWLKEQSLDPRDLCLALPAAAKSAGVRIQEQCAVLSHQAGSTGTAETTKGPFTADYLIACTGAWSGYLPTMPVTLSPKKGQMVAVQLTHQPSLDVVLRSPDVYLVPRGDGRIIIGATVEDAGFDRTVDPAATAWLLEKAAALWPPIQDADIEEAWTGLRPGSADGLPLIGRLRSIPDQPSSKPVVASSPGCLWIAAGHYRNGILLAPGTAKLLADAILQSTDSLPGHLAAFLPDRFMPAISAL